MQCHCATVTAEKIGKLKIDCLVLFMRAHTNRNKSSKLMSFPRIIFIVRLSARSHFLVVKSIHVGFYCIRRLHTAYIIMNTSNRTGHMCMNDYSLDSLAVAIGGTPDLAQTFLINSTHSSIPPCPTPFNHFSASPASSIFFHSVLKIIFIS